MTDSTNTATEPNTIRHSPGPYYYERDHSGCDDIWRIVAQPDQSTVAYLTFWEGDDTAEFIAKTEANARLIAATPDMFDALNQLIAAFTRLDITVSDGPLFQAFRYARHAIALADGTLSYRAC